MRNARPCKYSRPWLKETERERKSDKVVLLKDVIGDVFYENEMNFTPEGKNIIKDLAMSETTINYNNLFF